MTERTAKISELTVEQADRYEELLVGAREHLIGAEQTAGDGKTAENQESQALFAGELFNQVRQDNIELQEPENLPTEDNQKAEKIDKDELIKKRLKKAVAKYSSKR